jgi:soluble lytic murein transglycosylase-like protein
MDATPVRTRIPAVSLFTLIVAIAISVRPADAQIYSWRDADGHLVVSDRPSGTSVAYAPSASADAAAAEYRTIRPRVALSARAAEYSDIIHAHARRHGLSDDLVRAVIQVESAFNPLALSPKGAMGLMQLMPATADELGVINPFDPDENVRAGVAYLRRLIDRYDGRVELALAAYNAGPGAVDKYGEQVPPYRETRDYVRRIKSVTAIHVGPSRTIYKIVEVIDGRDVPRYSDTKPEGDFKVVTRR